MVKRIEIEKIGDDLQVTTINETVDVQKYSLEALQDQLSRLQTKRKQDEDSFKSSLDRTDSEITEIQDLIKHLKGG